VAAQSEARLANHEFTQLGPDGQPAGA
jgi:hypothetical protein